VVLEQNVAADVLHLSRPDLSSSAKGSSNSVTNLDIDSAALYAQPQDEQLMTQFSKQSISDFTVSCGTTNLLRMLSVEGTSTNAELFEIRKH
jgi:hypothetical protein